MERVKTYIENYRYAAILLVSIVMIIDVIIEATSNCNSVMNLIDQIDDISNVITVMRNDAL